MTRLHIRRDTPPSSASVASPESLLMLTWLCRRRAAAGGGGQCGGHGAQPGLARAAGAAGGARQAADGRRHGRRRLRQHQGTQQKLLRCKMRSIQHLSWRPQQDPFHGSEAGLSPNVGRARICPGPQHPPQPGSRQLYLSSRDRSKEAHVFSIILYCVRALCRPPFVLQPRVVRNGLMRCLGR